MSEGMAPPEILDDQNQLEAPPLAREFAEIRAGEHPLRLTYKELTIKKTELENEIMENQREIQGLESDDIVKEYKSKQKHGRLLQNKLRDTEIEIQKTDMEIQKKMKPGGISAPGVHRGFVRLNQPCNERDYDSKETIHSEKDNLDLVCSETSGGAENYRYRHVGNPGDPNIMSEDKISEEMKEAMRKNKNFSAENMATMGEFPPDVYKKAQNIAIRAYEGDVDPSDRRWIVAGARFGRMPNYSDEPFRGQISGSGGTDRATMDGLLKRDLMKKIYADDGIARKFIHRSAQENEKIRDLAHKAEYYRSIQDLDLPEGGEPMPQYNKQVVTDEMVEGWNPETKDYDVLIPEEEKQKFIESLNFKNLDELKRIANSLDIKITYEINEMEPMKAIETIKGLIISKKYPGILSSPTAGEEEGEGDADADGEAAAPAPEPAAVESEEEDAFGGGGKSKKRRKSKKHKSKMRKSKRRKSKRRKTRRKKR